MIFIAAICGGVGILFGLAALAILATQWKEVVDMADELQGLPLWWFAVLVVLSDFLLLVSRWLSQ